MAKAAINDLYLHEILGTPSAGAAGFVFLHTQADRDDDASRNALWHCSVDGEVRRLTDPALGANAPFLHPHAARVAFSRIDDGVPALWMLPLDGGEPHRLCTPGDGLVAITDWDVDRGVLLVCAERRTRADDAPAIVESLPYKLDGLGLVVGNRVRLAEIDETSGACTWCIDHGGDVREAKWSPDRTMMAWLQDEDGLQRQRTQLWLRCADGTVRQLATTLASMRDLAWSPDVSAIAVAGNTIEGASQSFLHVVDVVSGDAHRLGEIEVAIPGCVRWMEDDRLLLIDACHGIQRAVAVSPRHQRVHDVLFAPADCGHVIALGAARERIACVLGSADSGPTLWLADALDGAHPREAGDFNAWRRERPRMQIQKRRFEVPRGDAGSETIDAWLLQPEGPGPYPLLLDMHGGPEAHVTFDYETRVHWPVLIAQGWAILALNAVGSDSYGEEFTQRLRGHWGEYDLLQFATVADALRAEGLVEDVAVFGHSYGGFLAAWALASRLPLIAGVVSAGVIDQRSHAGTSDSGYYVGPYAMTGEPQDAAATYERLSPIVHAHRIDVPTLILQGTDDMRCPIGQSEQLYTTLVRSGRTDSRLVLFPGGQHHVSSTGRPSHREAWYGQLVDWLEHHRPR
ncbi:MAG: S9 family peptidase [Luteimonas sp.]